MKVVVDADRLTGLLADRLAAIVPDGIYVEADDGMVRYSAEEGRFPGQRGSCRVGRADSFVRTSFKALTGTTGHRLVGVCVHVLDELQDYVSEATHDPWPGRTAQPAPRAELRGSELHLWYDGGGEVVLACEPVPLTALGPVRPGRSRGQ